MAARKRKYNDPKTRSGIQSTKLAKRLQKFVLGQPEDNHSFGAFWKTIEIPDILNKNVEVLKIFCHEFYTAGATVQDELKPVTLSSAQVKGIQVLLGKTTPDLTAADINISDEEPATQEEIFERLVRAVGKEQAIMLAPDFKGSIN